MRPYIKSPNDFIFGATSSLNQTHFLKIINLILKKLNNIYLVGYRGSGKTTLGKFLAARLGWRFIDSDDEIIKSSGMTIREMVDSEGWSVFRERECRMIELIAGLQKCVVATGGGAVLNPGNISKIKASGKVIWLKTNPETIKARLLKDTNTKELRPSLTEKDFDTEIVETLKEREPLYKKAMDIQITTDNTDIESMCIGILEELQLLNDHAKR